MAVKASMQNLVASLGGRKTLGERVETERDLRGHVRKGLPYASVATVMVTYGVDTKTLARVLAIPERTLARRRHEKRLRADESDRVVRMARIAAIAEETLGDREKAVRWLHRPNRALGNAIPLEHLDTELGAREVEDVLGRIAHGVHS
jgi:putative toxin-antitoxin system antitoxin component (TIGR02293 family)